MLIARKDGMLSGVLLLHPELRSSPDYVVTCKPGRTRTDKRHADYRTKLTGREPLGEGRGEFFADQETGGEKDEKGVVEALRRECSQRRTSGSYCTV